MVESSMNFRMSETNVATLKEALLSQQKLLQKLCNELDMEREASSSAASEALSMILRLQGEKAAVKMEAEQYKRLAEEKMCYAEESLAIFEDLIYQKEMEIASLDFQVQAYRYKLLSMGCIDPGVGELKFPENLLQRNEVLFGETSVQSVGRRNSAPQIPLKFSYFKKGTSERERSASPEIFVIPKVLEEDTGGEINDQNLDLDRTPESSAFGDINSYSEQIRKLDEQVKELAGEHTANLRGGLCSTSLFSQVSTDISYDPTKGAIVDEVDQVKYPENVLKTEITTDSACSLSVHDVFEVPQTHEDLKGCGLQKKDVGKSVLQVDQRLGKPDSVPQEAVNPYVRDETDRLKKMLLPVHHENNLRWLCDGVSVDCHVAVVPPTIGIAESQAKFRQLNRTSEITEVERQDLRQESTNRGEEELKLLNEIREQLNTIQSEIRSWKSKKPTRQDDLSMVSLMEAMLHFWL